VAAAVRAAVRDAGKHIIIRRITKLHNDLLGFSFHYTALLPKNLPMGTGKFAMFPAKPANNCCISAKNLL
jgi:hypothetical protein